VLLVCAHVACFAYSWGPVAWVVPSEIFPLGVRGKAVSLTTTVNWLGNFCVGEIVPPLLSRWGVGGTFYTIAASLTCALVFTLLIGRETKGVTLERMEHVFRVQGTEQWRTYMKQNWHNGLVTLRIRDGDAQQPSTDATAAS
jgi:hypothetical protein